MRDAKATGRPQKFDMAVLVEGITRQLLEESRTTVGQVRHPGGKGRVRESALVDRLLRPYAPPTLSLTQNCEVASIDGGRSAELDVVLHDSRVPTLVDRQGFHVRPTNSRTLEARWTQKKQPKSAIVGPGNAVRFTHYDHHWPAAPIQGFIVAFRSKLGLPEIQRQLEQLHGSDAPWHRVDSVWVLERGYVVNWSEAGQLTEAIPTAETRLRARQSENFMPLFLDHLQTLYWDMPTPEVDLTRYGTLGSLEPDPWLT